MVTSFVAAMFMIVVPSDVSQPWLSVGAGCLILAFEHVGGVRYARDSLVFRNWITWHRVPYSNITAVIVDIGAGYQGGEPVVYLEVKGRRRRLKVLPASSRRFPDVERYAASLGNLLGIEPAVSQVAKFRTIGWLDSEDEPT